MEMLKDRVCLPNFHIWAVHLSNSILDYSVFHTILYGQTLSSHPLPTSYSTNMRHSKHGDVGGSPLTKFRHRATFPSKKHIFVAQNRKKIYMTWRLSRNQQAVVWSAAIQSPCSKPTGLAHSCLSDAACQIREILTLLLSVSDHRRIIISKLSQPIPSSCSICNTVVLNGPQNTTTDQ